YRWKTDRSRLRANLLFFRLHICRIANPQHQSARLPVAYGFFYPKSPSDDTKGSYLYPPFCRHPKVPTRQQREPITGHRNRWEPYPVYRIRWHSPKDRLNFATAHAPTEAAGIRAMGWQRRYGQPRVI